jgi:hypothetical protein
LTRPVGITVITCVWLLQSIITGNIQMAYALTADVKLNTTNVESDLNRWQSDRTGVEPANI